MLNKLDKGKNLLASFDIWLVPQKWRKEKPKTGEDDKGDQTNSMDEEETHDFSTGLHPPNIVENKLVHDPGDQERRHHRRERHPLLRQVPGRRRPDRVVHGGAEDVGHHEIPPPPPEILQRGGQIRIQDEIDMTAVKQDQKLGRNILQAKATNLESGSGGEEHKGPFPNAKRRSLKLPSQPIKKAVPPPRFAEVKLRGRRKKTLATGRTPESLEKLGFGKRLPIKWQ
nr:hypothetical protein DVH24_006583 [Ipomoea batatas]